MHAAGLSRDEVFITTKLQNDDHLQADKALRHSLAQLEMEHVDLYLIHWPVPAHDHYVQAWQSLIELQKEGLARAIGVSNFNQPHLERIIRETGVSAGDQPGGAASAPPAARPAPRARRPRRPARGVEPAGEGPGARRPGHHRDRGRARAHAAQVVLRWHLQLGHVVIPKSVTQSRIEENLGIFDFHLTDADMEAIETLDVGERTGPTPTRSSARRAEI